MAGSQAKRSISDHEKEVTSNRKLLRYGEFNLPVRVEAALFNRIFEVSGVAAELELLLRTTQRKVMLTIHVLGLGMVLELLGTQRVSISLVRQRKHIRSESWLGPSRRKLFAVP
jgi:hypothetical protein